MGYVAHLTEESGAELPHEGHIIAQLPHAVAVAGVVVVVALEGRILRLAFPPSRG